jgi:hypothetical protein
VDGIDRDLFERLFRHSLVWIVESDERGIVGP